jgi:hypothetical protein
MIFMLFVMGQCGRLKTKLRDGSWENGRWEMGVGAWGLGLGRKLKTATENCDSEFTIQKNPFNFFRNCRDFFDLRKKHNF